MQLRRNLWTLLMFVAAVGCQDRIPRDAEGVEASVKSKADKADKKAPGADDDEGAAVDEAVDADVPDVAADGGLALTCEKGGAVASLRVEFTCRSVTVYTCKDLSNLVIEFEDGTRQRFEGQNGHVNDFSGTGANAGKRIVRVWVKAGANHSGEGPGYGQRVETTVSECPPPPAAGSGGTGGCVAGPDAPCGDIPGGSGGSGGAGGCVAGPDMPCGDLPSAGIGGAGGAGGDDPDGPQ